MHPDSPVASRSRVERGLALILVAQAFALALVSAIACASEPTSSARRPHPFAASALARDRRFELEGNVVERIDAGPYAYFLVRDGARAEHWVVSLAATSPDATVSDTRPCVRAQVLGRAHDFESPRLARRFDTLLFGIVRTAEPTDPHEGETE